MKRSDPMTEESFLPPQYAFRLIPVEYIKVIWYEGYQVDTYEVREDILMDDWSELQTFLKKLQDQRFEQKKAKVEYVGYTKVKLSVRWDNEYDRTYRVDVGDSPDFNPYKEWIGDYLEMQTPRLDFGQKIRSD